MALLATPLEDISNGFLLAHFFAHGKLPYAAPMVPSMMLPIKVIFTLKT